MHRLKNDCMDVTDLRELFYHPRKSYRTLARVFHGGARMSLRQLMNAVSMSEATVSEAIKHMKQAKLIHVAGWQRSTSQPSVMMPIYQIGKGPDVAKPKPKDPDAKKRSWAHRQRLKEQAQAQVEEAYQWRDLVQVLVPKRTEEQARQVNWMYLNWISGGTYA